MDISSLSGSKGTVNSFDPNISNSSTFRGVGSPSRHTQSDIGGKVQSLAEWLVSQASERGINESMRDANFATMEGEYARETMMQWGQTDRHNAVRYVDATARKLLKTYEFALLGGIVSYGADMDGNQAIIPCFKPMFPRNDFDEYRKGKIKPIKYESPKGSETHPLMPFVTEEVAEKFYDKFGSRPNEGESFYRWIKRINAPIKITEGMYKATLLMQEGYFAISLRGVTNWHYKQSEELFPLLLEFATVGREITIVFDQDSKTETVKNVSREIRKLSNSLSGLGCEVRVAVWHEADGKGIDDATVKMGVDWLHMTMAKSLSLPEWKAGGLPQQFKNLIQRYKRLPIKPTRQTEGGYLPTLPSDIAIGSITLIEANMGSGKTHVGIDGVIQQWIASGGNVLRLDPLLSLGAQGSRLSNIVHSSEYDLASREGYQMFCRDISTRHGAAVCFNSIKKIPQWFITDPNRPLLLVLDEVNQGLDYLIQGSNLGSKQPEILSYFSEICFTCGWHGAIVAAEAEIHPRSVELLKSLSGSTDVRYFKHHRPNATWNVDLGTGRLDGFMLKILEDVQTKKQIIFTDSQKASKKIDRRIAASFPTKKIVRIDSETNRDGKFSGFFDNPDEWLSTVQPDVLVCSPSVKTGVSITREGAFDAVYGYFVGAIDPDGWMQSLGRYRPTVDRIVCAPKFVLTSGDESLMRSANVKDRLEATRDAVSRFYATEALEETDDRKVEVRLLAQDYYADMVSLRGAQKAIALEYLTDVLREAGHTVTPVEWGGNPQEASNLSQVQDSIDIEDAVKYAIAEPYESIEDAQKVVTSECSLEDEIRAKKTFWREAFPGIPFNSKEDCYWLIAKKGGSISRGAEMQSAIENLEASKELDIDLVAQICGDELGLTHRIPKRHMKAMLLQQSGILALASRDSQFCNDDEICLQIQKWAVHMSRELRYNFGLTIAKEYTDSQGRKRHTPIDIVSKLLKRIGLSAYVLRRFGERGNETRIYGTRLDRVRQEDQGAAWVYRQKALDAARARLQDIHPCVINETVYQTSQGEIKDTPEELVEDVLTIETSAVEVLEDDYEYPVDDYEHDPEILGDLPQRFPVGSKVITLIDYTEETGYRQGSRGRVLGYWMQPTGRMVIDIEFDFDPNAGCDYDGFDGDDDSEIDFSDDDETSVMGYWAEEIYLLPA